MKRSILAVGSMAFDSITTPAGKVEHVLGGSANYFSVAASFFTPVEMIAVVGEDFPKSHLQWLSSRKIDLSGVQTVSGKTFSWVGEYDGNLNEAKTLSTNLNVFEKFNPRLSEAHRSTPYLFLGNIDPVLQQSVLDQTKIPDLVVADSMNFWITGKRSEVMETLRRVDILSINEGEAYLLSGQNNLVRASEHILDLGPRVVIIKRGEYGAAVFSGAETFLAPAFPVGQVVDPTGAGDSFAGAFFGSLAQCGVTRGMAERNPVEWESHLRKAVLAGCVMASFTVEDFGLHRLMRVSESDFQARETALRRMIAF